MKKKNKIIIIISISSAVILLIVGLLLNNYINKLKNEKIKMGNPFYEKMHNLYYYGGQIDFEQDDNFNRLYIEKDGKKYYKVKNYDEAIKSFITDKELTETNSFLNIIKDEENYYMKDIGRGLSGYYGTELTVKKMGKNTIKYVAKSKFCKLESRVTYGEGCKNDDYYYIEKPFSLVKEDGTWKVSEYTSIFEANDNEFK